MFKNSTDQHSYCQKDSNPLNKTNILWHLVELSDNAASVFRNSHNTQFTKTTKPHSTGLLLL